MNAIQECRHNENGAKLGLAVGDILVAINEDNVSQLSSSEVLKLFRKQTLPFDVTFKLCFDAQPVEEEEEEESEEEEFDDSFINSYINSTTARTSTTNSKWKDFATYESDDEDSIMSNTGTYDDDDGTISTRCSFKKACHQAQSKI